MRIKMFRTLGIGLLAFLFVLSCKKEGEKEGDKEMAYEKVPGINVDYMDKTVSPKDDFFRYVNGSWLDATEIPADRARWGSFDELRQRTDEDALAILNEAINDPDLDAASDQAKAVYLYQTIMDVESR